MPTAREIVSSNPGLRTMRQWSRFLLFAVPALLAGAIFTWGQPLAKLLAGAAVLVFCAASYTLLVLGRRIEALQSGPQPVVARPKGPPFFSGVLGGLGLLFLIMAGAATVATVLALFGLVQLGPVWWLPPFFAVLLGFTGLLMVGLGMSVSKAQEHAKFLKESAIQGTARIVNFKDQGTTDDDGPWAELTLQVTLPGQELYTATVTTVVPRLKVGLLTSPYPVNVRVNPMDRNEVLIEW